MNDARDQAAQKEALKGIASATAVESTGYTADQGKALEGLAAKGYKIDFDDAQKAYVARNEAGDTKTIAMQGVTDFMGERSAGSMSREQQDSARMLAMADVIGRTDPSAACRCVSSSARANMLKSVRPARKSSGQERTASRPWTRKLDSHSRIPCGARTERSVPPRPMTIWPTCSKNRALLWRRLCQRSRERHERALRHGQHQAADGKQGT